MIEIDPQTCAVCSVVYRAVENLCGEEVAESLWYDGDTNYGLCERSADSTHQAWVEPNDDRYRIDGAASGEWRPEDHPAALAETVPP